MKYIFSNFWYPSKLFLPEIPWFFLFLLDIIMKNIDPLKCLINLSCMRKWMLRGIVYTDIMWDMWLCIVCVCLCVCVYVLYACMLIFMKCLICLIFNVLESVCIVYLCVCVCVEFGYVCLSVCVCKYIRDETGKSCLQKNCNLSLRFSSCAIFFLGPCNSGHS